MRRGFTVLELVIAIAIVAILAGIAVPTYRGHIERQHRAKAIADIRALDTKMKQYFSEFGSFPRQLGHVVNPVPTDPWGHPYKYLELQSGQPGINGKRRRDKNLNPINSDYELYSVGPDGETSAQLQASKARDDIVRAADGGFVGVAADY